MRDDRRNGSTLDSGDASFSAGIIGGSGRVEEKGSELLTTFLLG
jgi:hypothetical protein